MLMVCSTLISADWSRRVLHFITIRASNHVMLIFALLHCPVYISLPSEPSNHLMLIFGPKLPTVLSRRCDFFRRCAFAKRAEDVVWPRAARLRQGLCSTKAAWQRLTCDHFPRGMPGSDALQSAMHLSEDLAGRFVFFCLFQQSASNVLDI